jgi:hypothetical protein
MAKYSQKMMGKEVGDAKVYAEPHTMTGEKVTMKPTKRQDPNTMAAKDFKPNGPAMRVSVGDPARDDVKTTGIKIRGTGAATKGTMARGPMA